jgi:gliding motility-associated protein GldM
MINMMYLVLTALLALNVSAEILQAFDSLRNSLKDTAQTQAQLNGELSENILAAIANQEKSKIMIYSYMKPVVSDINTQSEEAVQFLNGLIAELEKIGDKDEATGELRHKDETNANYAFWLGNDQANDGRGNGKAIELREKLNAYINWANQIYAQQSPTKEAQYFKPLVVEPMDDPNVTNTESKGKSWEYFSFHDKPVVADLAMIEKYKMDIRGVQAGLLNLMKSRINEGDYPIDSLVAMDAPMAEVVTAGMQFQTRLGVGAMSSAVRPEFLGHGIKVDPNGSTAMMTIPANASNIPQGKSEGIQHYTASIKVPKLDGTFTTLNVKGQFKVRRPEVVVRSKALQLLYKDCGNTVDVDVPALGDNYNPDFSRSKGGAILKSSNSKKEITIVPNSPKFKLSVYSQTNGQNVEIDDLDYNVVRPPLPRLALFKEGNQEINGLNGVSKRSTVYVKLIPDSEFARTLPRDARYKAKKITLLLDDGLGPPKEVGSVDASDINSQKGTKINLYQGAMRQAYDGTKAYLEVEGVQRVNFQGKAIDENMPRPVLFIPIKLKN